ncbi:SIR2-domain-containing protein [Polychaeton citri CBS 116435]|uniref:SIR2-domain-containing protein n=1 Tax=Polychaeton citri CBS 116435 TaxID=1314669 RepID=A0A9P4UKJ9_9PEZI|nr:SIR2-domain-containing protein [Polychaeton citri CBS 116435]
MASPPLSPTLTAAHTHRKRRHSDIVELTTDPRFQNAGQVAEMAAVSVIDQTPYSSDESDTESAFEELADMAETQPYLGSGPEAVSLDQAETLKRLLREVGYEKFLEEIVPAPGDERRKFGTAFGIDPYMISDDQSYLKLLQRVLQREAQKRQKLPAYNNIEDAAYLIRRSHNIVVISGAGISTSLGIPDFRSKEGGFYSALQERGYAEPESVFDLREFDQDPTLFYQVAHEILPKSKDFSPTHGFIRLLQDKGKLQTDYTQNIDNLEAAAGIDGSRLIQCHGSFASATCRKCGYKVKGEVIFDDIRKRQVPFCKKCRADIHQRRENAPKKRGPSKQTHDWDGSESESDEEPGVMKPDITFFHEKLSDTFFDRFNEEQERTDLVIVIGTSLKVAPVNEIPNKLPSNVPHIYISNEAINHVNFDIQLLGQCDDVVVELCNHIGGIEWKLRHKMIPHDFKARVAMEDECPWKWRIAAIRFISDAIPKDVA